MAFKQGVQSGRPGAMKGRKLPAEVLTQDEVKALLRTCSRRAPTGVRNAALIAVLWRAGLRVTEALDLRVRDLDPRHNTVTVMCGKGGKQRTVGMDDEAFALVMRWVDTRKRLGISGRAALFCTLQGTRVSGQYVRAMLRRKAAKVGVEGRVNPHAFRHTFAAELMREGWGLTEIQDQLGHASLDGTAKYLQRIAPVDIAAKARQRPAWA